MPDCSCNAHGGLPNAAGCGGGVWQGFRHRRAPTCGKESQDMWRPTTFFTPLDGLGMARSAGRATGSCLCAPAACDPSADALALAEREAIELLLPRGDLRGRRAGAVPLRWILGGQSRHDEIPMKAPHGHRVVAMNESFAHQTRQRIAIAVPDHRGMGVVEALVGH